jgi:ribosomal protein S18 acetylase RimI-like enzyme
LRHLQRQGIGSQLLMAALARTYHVVQFVPFCGVGLRSLNDATTKLYQKYGFRIAPKENNHPLMLLPMKSVTDIFARHS